MGAGTWGVWGLSARPSQNHLNPTPTIPSPPLHQPAWLPGIMSADPDVNPGFGEWNLAVAVYCDGGGYVGRRGEVAVGNTTLHMDGWKIIMAILDGAAKSSPVALLLPELTFESTQKSSPHLSFPVPSTRQIFRLPWGHEHAKECLFGLRWGAGGGGGGGLSGGAGFWTGGAGMGGGGEGGRLAGGRGGLRGGVDGETAKPKMLGGDGGAVFTSVGMVDSDYHEGFLGSGYGEAGSGGVNIAESSRSSNGSNGDRAVVANGNTGDQALLDIVHI
ncbi:unnamed protein product [Closterium sp. NIES-65]|nr:unnamed protein product [Closterium sp. NIES-65]